jgi:aminopeptidase
LFDENASCHFALGKAYPTTIKNGADMSEEEFAQAGGNDSLIHVDFMFGTADMKITGIDFNGGETVFFDKGEYLPI